MPQLWLEVWIEGDRHEQQNFSNWLVKSRCTKAESPETADLVVFTGGTDVDPVLYGEKPMSSTESPDRGRDAREIVLYQMCVQSGIPMLGICRGSQFLAVMNGAKLYQHIDNHNGAHDIFDIKDKRIISNVSSVHHQAVVADPNGGMEVLADSPKARNRWLREGINRPGHHMDVEAFWYRDTACLGIQGHPEYTGYHGFAKWACEKMDEYFIANPDIELRPIHEGSKYKYRRVKACLLEERKHVLTNRNVKETTDA